MNTIEYTHYGGFLEGNHSQIIQVIGPSYSIETHGDLVIPNFKTPQYEKTSEGCHSYTKAMASC